MSVEITSPRYNQLRGKWKKCRDAYAGQDAVHAAGETYLPRLDGQTDAQYSSYKANDRFLNLMKRTVEALTGIATRVDPTVTDPAGILELVTGSGEGIEDYAQALMREMLITGMAGTLVDYPAAPDGISVADAERLNLAPVMVPYTAENIRNWKYTSINNVQTLSLVVLREAADTSTDEFEHEYDDRYRVLDLADGYYRQRIYEGGAVIAEIFPMSNGKRLEFIPFILHGGGMEPPLLDLVDTNLAHYRLMADYMHGLRYVALPTPYIIGASAEDAPNTIGPQKVWILESPESKVGMLEFTGAGLGAINAEIRAMEDNMAKLGARMLGNEPSVPATATAAAIDNANQNAGLIMMIGMLNYELNQAISYMAEWSGRSNGNETFIEMTTDLLPTKLAGTELLALVKSWADGAISRETLFSNLQRGEIISAERTFDEEMDAIEAYSMPEPAPDSTFSQAGQADVNE